MRGLVDEITNIIPIPRLLVEFEEAKHNLKIRRVVKEDGSSDDLFQSLVGAYFGISLYTSHEDVDLSELRRNLVGANSVRRVLSYLNYR